MKTAGTAGGRLRIFRSFSRASKSSGAGDPASPIAGGAIMDPPSQSDPVLLRIRMRPEEEAEVRTSPSSSR